MYQSSYNKKITQRLGKSRYQIIDDGTISIIVKENQMTSCLFVYRLRVVLPNNVETINDNFINPLNVISMYWETKEDGTTKRLNIFLVNGKSMNVSESVGRKFVDHMEDFLRYLIAAPQNPVRNTIRQTGKEQHPRKALDVVEYVDDDQIQSQEGKAEWVGN